MLKDNISMMESMKSKEMLNSMSVFNEELENKIATLETRLRKVQ